MSETTPNGAAASTPSGGLVSPSSQGQAQPSSGGGGGFQVPAGHRLVPESDWAAAERNREVAAGSKAFWEKAKGYGITKAEDFDQFGPAIKAMRDRKIDPSMFSRAFSPEADEDLGREAKAFDPDSFREELRNEWRTEQATNEWKAMTAKEKDVVETALRDFYGDEQVDDWSRHQFKLAVSKWLDDNREMYPKDHPLHDKYLQPVNESHAKKAVEYFKAEKAKYAGAASASKADAAIASEKRGASTTAGRSGSSGAPDKSKTETRPGGLPPKASVEAAAAALRSARENGKR